MYKQAKDMIKVTPVAITQPILSGIPDAEGLSAYCARVSNPSNQHNHETADKLLAYCAKHGHWSVFEQVDLTLEIEVPRDISRQIIRHRSGMPQEFCIAGDSKITTLLKSGASKKVKIEDLYKRFKSKQYSDMSDWLVKVYDEDKEQFIPAKVVEVFDTGVKPVYNLVLSSGKSIRATKDHKFFVRGKGFKRLEDITTDDFIGLNGVPKHQSRDWLVEYKKKSIENGGGLHWMADVAGVSYHTIRKWLKIHNLQFTKREVAMYTSAWNKGLAREAQPMFGKMHKEDTKIKMSESAKLRGENHNWFTGNYRSWRESVADHCHGLKKTLYKNNGGICEISGKSYSLNELEVDHIKPVCFYPELALVESNLRLIHKDEHKKKSAKERKLSCIKMKFDKVRSVEFVGNQQTYDMEVDHVSHNYVANGIVTHNSQRYADVTEDMFCLRELRMEDDKNRQNSIKEIPDASWEEEWLEDQREIIDLVRAKQKKWRERKAAKEVVRVIFPEGNTMSRMYFKAPIRSWIHYCKVRGEKGVTQEEHTWVAEKARDCLLRYFPSLKGMLEDDT